MERLNDIHDGANSSGEAVDTCGEVGGSGGGQRRRGQRWRWRLGDCGNGEAGESDGDGKSGGDGTARGVADSVGAPRAATATAAARVAAARAGGSEGGSGEVGGEGGGGEGGGSEGSEGEGGGGSEGGGGDGDGEGSGKRGGSQLRPARAHRRNREWVAACTWAGGFEQCGAHATMTRPTDEGRTAGQMAGGEARDRSPDLPG